MAAIVFDIIFANAFHREVSIGIAEIREGQRERVKLIKAKSPKGSHTHTHTNREGGRETGCTIVVCREGLRVDYDVAAITTAAHYTRSSSRFFRPAKTARFVVFPLSCSHGK